LNSVQRLTKEEYEIIKTHVASGCAHLEKVMDLSPEVRAIVSEHHERIDGSGYPRGLKNDKLSPMGRLAGIVDTFDAMTSARPYRSHTFTVGEALQQLEDDAPEKYDNEIVYAFASLVESTLEMQAGEEDKGQGGIKGVQFSLRDRAQLKHLQYYFRIPIAVRRVGKVGGKLAFGPEEKVIAHKISCMGVGLLSPRAMPLDQNIVISSPKLEAIALNNLSAVVTRCQDHSNGWYTVDAQFLQPQKPKVVDKIRTVTEVREVSALVDT
jgi:hypothetical protein